MTIGVNDLNKDETISTSPLLFGDNLILNGNFDSSLQYWRLNRQPTATVFFGFSGNSVRVTTLSGYPTSGMFQFFPVPADGKTNYYQVKGFVQSRKGALCRLFIHSSMKGSGTLTGTTSALWTPVTNYRACTSTDGCHVVTYPWTSTASQTCTYDSISVNELSCTDADSDGSFANIGCPNAIDCNDADASVSPTFVEVCDGKDNDCDKLIDEGVFVLEFHIGIINIKMDIIQR